MRARSRFPRALAGDARGVTIVEFAMVAMPMCVVLMGITDMGYHSYVSSVLQGALHEAARMATVGDKTGAEIDDHVRQRLKEFSKNATVTITKKSYSEFSGVGKPEKITQDTNPIGQYNKGDCFEDANGNGSYDLDRGQSGLGGAEDVVYYDVKMTYPRLTPVMGLLGWGNTDTVESNTVLKNQPYAAQSFNVKVVC